MIRFLRSWFTAVKHRRSHTTPPGGYVGQLEFVRERVETLKLMQRMQDICDHRAKTTDAFMAANKKLQTAIVEKLVEFAAKHNELHARVAELESRPEQKPEYIN